jgi:hypothetical protein
VCSLTSGTRSTAGVWRLRRIAWRHPIEASALALLVSRTPRARRRASRAADAAGFDWPPHRAADPRPPYELQPGTGRRGPESLWRRFDEAVRQLNTAATGQNMLDVARTYDELAAAAAELAEAVEREDGASAWRPRARARRSD